MRELYDKTVEYVQGVFDASDLDTIFEAMVESLSLEAWFASRKKVFWPLLFLVWLFFMGFSAVMFLSMIFVLLPFALLFYPVYIIDHFSKKRE